MSDKKKCTPTFKVYRPADLKKKWFVWYYQDGRRIRKYGDINQFNTAADREQAAQLLIDRLKGEYQLPAADRLYQWLKDRRPMWRRKTYQTYKSKLDNLMRELAGRPITADAVRQFFNDLAGRVNRTTYNAYRAQLGQIFQGTGLDNLYPEIEKVKATQTPAKYFQKHQVQRLGRFMRENDPELWFACQCLYYCFLRPNSEMRFLRVSDFDLDRWVIQVKGDISKNHKTEFVSVPVAFRKDVHTFISGREAEEWLFPSPRDASKPYSYNILTKRHRRVLKRLGFGTEYKLYSWKHTGAVACVQAGVNIKDLQIQLRHSSLEMVDKYLRQLGVNNLDDLERKFPAI